MRSFSLRFFFYLELYRGLVFLISDELFLSKKIFVFFFSFFIHFACFFFSFGAFFNNSCHNSGVVFSLWS